MSVDLREDGKVLVIKLTGKHDFHGCTAGAPLKHLRDAERLGLVGHTTWEQGMAVVCKPFTTDPIRYFDGSEVDEAQKCIHTDQLAAQ